MPYFGVIEEIWELDYSEFRVPVFKCQWVNRNTDVNQGEMGFTLVDLHKVSYKDKPFIMAEQARHVFYVQDPCDSRWSVVLQGRTNNFSLQNHDSTLVFVRRLLCPHKMPSIIEEQVVNDVVANRTDHDEGYGRTCQRNCVI